MFVRCKTHCEGWKFRNSVKFSASHRSLIAQCEDDRVNTPARILVVDDDERIAAAVRRALTYEGYDVGVVHDGYDALDAVRRSEPDLVVLDVMMPGIDGVGVAGRLRSDGYEVPILMLTARTSVADRVDGLDAGADDYLVKPFAYPELLARVRSLLRRSETSDRDVLAYSDVRIDVDAMEVSRGGRDVDLTALEFSLLEYFMRNPRTVLSRAQILAEVWGLEADTTSNVVDVYVGYLRKKLEVEGEPKLLHAVRSVGYVFKES